MKKFFFLNLSFFILFIRSSFSFGASVTPDIFVYVHGTSTLISDLERKIAHSALPELFSKGSESELLDLREQFPGLAEIFLSSIKGFKGEAYYFQWSGRLGENHWDSAAEGLSQKLKEVYGLGVRKKSVFLVSHSHGGQVLKRVLTKSFVLGLKRSSRVHVYSINMPLVEGRSPAGFINPKIVCWLNFQTRSDFIRALGSLLMARISRREKPIREVEITKNGLQQVENHLIPYYGGDPHNGFVKNEESRGFIQRKIREVNPGNEVFKSF